MLFISTDLRYTSKQLMQYYQFLLTGVDLIMQTTLIIDNIFRLKIRVISQLFIDA